MVGRRQKWGRIMSEWEHLKTAMSAGRISRRDFMGRAAALGVSAALVGNLLTKAAFAAETPKKGGHLILGLNGASASDSLDPTLNTVTFTQVLDHQLWNVLTEVDENLRLQPVLAESWEAKPGAKEWVFKIRKGVTFHNGKTLTAADVVYSIDYHRKEGSKSPTKVLLAPIVEFKATGPYEISVKLNTGYADLPFILSDYHLAIGPEGTNFLDGVGTGAFVLESFQPGVKALTKRNPNYWRTDRGHVDSVETIGINDPAARVNALLSGSVHLINRVDPKILSLIENNKRIQIFEIAGSAHYTFPMMLDKAPYNNPDVRLALKYAIDREAVVKKVLLGHGKAGNDQPVPSFNPYFAADLPQRSYDPDKAKFHFKKSGYDGPIVLSASDGAFTGAVDAAQVYQANAAKAGINLQVDRVPADGYWDNTWNVKPFVACYWDGRPTADLVLSLTYKSDSSWNDTHWKRDDFDKILIAARSELDEGKRKQMYGDLQKMLWEEGGLLLPMFSNTIDAGSSKVKGLVQVPINQLANYTAPEKVWLEG
jgi:peptide/nickel transport system substrate-binding protein